MCRRVRGHKELGVLASVLEHAGSADLSLHSAVAGMEKVSAVGEKNIL